MATSIFILLALASLFVAYYFYISKDGELRKIFIAKHLGLAFLFFALALITWSGNEQPAYYVISCAPYTFAMFRLVKYLFKITKK